MCQSLGLFCITTIANNLCCMSLSKSSLTVTFHDHLAWGFVQGETSIGDSGVFILHT